MEWQLLILPSGAGLRNVRKTLSLDENIFRKIGGKLAWNPEVRLKEIGGQ